MHIQKCARKTNAQEIGAGELVGYMPWHFLHNWKFIAHIQDGCILFPSPQLIKPGWATLASLKSDLKESRKHMPSVLIA